MVSNTSIDEIIARVRKMEMEYAQLMTLSESIASVTTREELHNAVNGTFREILGFTHVLILLEDVSQEKFKLFYHHHQVDYEQYKSDGYSSRSNIFASALNSPEPIRISKKKINQIPNAPRCIKNAFETTSSFVLCAIPSKDFNGVLFIGFDRYNDPEENRLNLFKRLSVQLGITLTNILLAERNNLAKIGASIIDVPREATSDNLGIIGNSKALNDVRSLIKSVSNTGSTILINGESGTGKELVAKAIHYNSGRSKKKLIKINCAAIPKDLLESELFGHEKGSFTGAITHKIGKFAQAHQGTLFLDDICEMPIELQAKLLRVLQEKEIQRIGSSETITVDIRIIAATNKDLLQEVHHGNFRADLFYRLNVLPIYLPPLRERIDDIPDLAKFFIQRYCVKNKKPIKVMAAKALDALYIHNWPGNIRELEHTIERAVVLSSEAIIKEIHISNNSYQNSPLATYDIKTWHDFEKQYILSVVKHCRGKISGPNGAATLLEIPATTLMSKMKRLGIQKRHSLSNK